MTMKKQKEMKLIEEKEIIMKKKILILIFNIIILRI